MTPKEEELLFDNFLRKWEKQLNKIASMLKYLSTYSELTEGNNRFNELNIDDIYDRQLDWIRLLSKLDNPIERTFFKEYWVPIQKEGYDYFIDLSSESLPLFSANYFSCEPYQWFKIYVTKDLHQFLYDIGTSEFDVDLLFKTLDEEEWEFRDKIFAEREELSYEDTIELSPLEKENFIKELPNLTFEGNCITINGVNSLIVGLLPLDCEITLNNFNIPLDHRFTNFVLDSPTYEAEDNRVRNIKSLVYILQSIGFKNIKSYSLTFDAANQCKAVYTDHTFTIIHEDREFLNDFINKFKSYQEE